MAIKPIPPNAPAILYGRGASGVTDAQISAFIHTPGRTADEIRDAAIANGVSAAQISKATPGNAAYSLQNIDRYMASQGVTPPPSAEASAASETPVQPSPAAVLYGPGNVELSDADIQAYINQPGRTEEQILDAALANQLSVAQIARAMAGHPEYSLERLQQHLQDQGIAPPAAPAAELPARDPRYVNLQGSVLYGPGNAAISDAEIQAYISTAERTEDQILDAALANGVSLAQIAHAMDGDPVFTMANLNDVVSFKQDTSRLELLMDQQDHLLGALDAAPSAQASQQAMDALRTGLAQLEPQLEAARAKVDTRIAEGQAQDAIAAQAENDAAALKAQFDPLQLERLHAQAQIDEQQAAVDAAQREVNAAQAALDAATQDIANAASIHKKSRRHRARGEAQAAATAAQTALSAAQQKLSQLQPSLAQAQANAAAPIAAAQALQLRWEAAQKTADAERAQSKVLLGNAQRAVQLEVALKQALSSNETQLIQRGQTQAGQLQKQIDAGELKGRARADALKHIALDRTEAAELVQRIDAQTTADRLRESELAQAAVPLQTRAVGTRLIAENLLCDAAKLDQANAQVGAELAAAKSEFDAASQRLLAAKIAVGKADFAVDWDQAKKDAKKSSQALAVDQPQLDAAQAELDAAQAAYDTTQAQVSSLQHLATPLGTATLEAAFEAGSAVQRAATAETQANAAAGWAQLAQARYQSSDQLLADTQLGLIQSRRTEGELDPQADTAAKAYATQVNETRAAAQATRAEQSKQNELAIQAGGAQILSSFLKDKAAHASEVYAQAQAQLAVQQEDFQKAAAHAGELAPAADAARQELAGTDLDAAFAFACARSKLSPEQLQAAQADKAGFVQTWQEHALSERKTERKQIHLLDDLAQFQKNDPGSQAARQHVLDTGHALEQAAQAAIEASDTVQASLIVTGLLGQATLDDQAQLAQASVSAADLSAQVGAHAMVLDQAAQDEVMALQQGNAATTELAAQIASQAPQAAAAWNQAAAAWKTQAASEASTLQALQTQLGQDTSARSELQTKIQTGAAEVEQLHGFANALLKETAHRDEHIDELHRDRQLYDDAYKRSKKGALLKIILGAVISVVITAASMGALVEMAPLIMGAAMAQTAVGAGVAMGVGAAMGSAISQGINVGVGLQDKFSLKNVALSGLSAGLTRGLLGSVVGRSLSAGVLSGMTRVGATSLLGNAAGHVALGATGAAINTGVQGVMTAVGLQEKMDWSQVAAVGLAMGLGSATYGAFQKFTAEMGTFGKYALDAVKNTGLNLVGNVVGMGAFGGAGAPGWLNQVLANSLDAGDGNGLVHGATPAAPKRGSPSPLIDVPPTAPHGEAPFANRLPEVGTRTAIGAVIDLNHQLSEPAAYVNGNLASKINSVHSALGSERKLVGDFYLWGYAPGEARLAPALAATNPPPVLPTANTPIGNTRKSAQRHHGIVSKTAQTARNKLPARKPDLQSNRDIWVSDENASARAALSAYENMDRTHPAHSPVENPFFIRAALQTEMPFAFSKHRIDGIAIKMREYIPTEVSNVIGAVKYFSEGIASIGKLYEDGIVISADRLMGGLLGQTKVVKDAMRRNRAAAAGIGELLTTDPRTTVRNWVDGVSSTWLEGEQLERMGDTHGAAEKYGEAWAKIVGVAIPSAYGARWLGRSLPSKETLMKAVDPVIQAVTPAVHSARNSISAINRRMQVSTEYQPLFRRANRSQNNSFASAGGPRIREVNPRIESILSAVNRNSAHLRERISPVWSTVNKNTSQLKEKIAPVVTRINQHTERISTVTKPTIRNIDDTVKGISAAGAAYTAYAALNGGIKLEANNNASIKLFNGAPNSYSYTLSVPAAGFSVSAWATGPNGRLPWLPGNILGAEDPSMPRTRWGSPTTRRDDPKQFSVVSTTMVNALEFGAGIQWLGNNNVALRDWLVLRVANAQLYGNVDLVRSKSLLESIGASLLPSATPIFFSVNKALFVGPFGYTLRESESNPLAEVTLPRISKSTGPGPTTYSKSVSGTLNPAYNQPEPHEVLPWDTVPSPSP